MTVKLKKGGGVFLVMSPTNKLKAAILKVLSDDYLHSVAEIAEETEADRTAVKAALVELRQDNKVFTMRRWWSII